PKLDDTLPLVSVRFATTRAGSDSTGLRLSSAPCRATRFTKKTKTPAIERNATMTKRKTTATRTKIATTMYDNSIRHPPNRWGAALGSFAFCLRLRDVLGGRNGKAPLTIPRQTARIPA